MKKEMTTHEAGGRNSFMRILLLPLVVGSFLLAGCNTFKGFGEDITGAATWSQEKMSGNGGDSSTKAAASDSQYVQNPPQFPKAN
jgi:predicted small secreted protein